MPPRVALFAEGSISPPLPRQKDPLATIWQTHLPQVLGISPFEWIFPISKTHLIAMDSNNPPMSGASEPLDQYMTRMLISAPFDAAVIAWDLIPSWNPQQNLCRWEEILNLYNCISKSTALSLFWTQKASIKLSQLKNNKANGVKQAPSKINNYDILAICMEPMFEGLLTQDEKSIKSIFSIKHKKNPDNWPTSGWGLNNALNPDISILQQVICSLRSIPMGQQPKIMKQIPGDFRTNKTAWGEYILRAMLQDDSMKKIITNHSICQRLNKYL